MVAPVNVVEIAANGKRRAAVPPVATRADHVDLNTLLAEPTKPVTFETSLGVILRLKKVAVMPMQRAMEGLEAPTPPTFYNEEAEREEPNPTDPGYLKALRVYHSEVSELTTRVTLGRGTEVQSLPEGVDPVNGSEWVEEVEFTSNGRTIVPDYGIARYVAWLRWYVLSDKDILSAVQAVQVYNGWVQEADVEKATSDFRDTDERGTDLVSGVAEEPAH